MMTKEISNIENVKDYLQTLINSKQLPVHIKNVEQAFMIKQMGDELGFPTLQAFHYLIPILGKLSLSAKAVGALLRKGGVRYITKEDGVYVFADGTTSDIAVKKDGVKPIDRRTTIDFYRDGLTETCSFTWRDAEAQGLTIKDNWVRMAKEMLFARCLSKGANRIGSDLLLGLYTAEEMADTFLNEKQVKREEDGTIAEVIEIKESVTKQ